MIRRVYRAVFPPKLSEEDVLIEKAKLMGRYTPHHFFYKNYQFFVSDFISVAYQIKEYFGAERMQFTSTSKQPVIIDCGANVGVSIMYFKKLFPESTMIAFEPDPQICALLKKNIEVNNVKNVAIHELAVWKNNEGIEFGVEGADGGSIFLDGKKVVIKTKRLKEVLTSFSEVDFLKLDIEGAELEVLKDCSEELKRVKNLFVEYHSFISNKQELNTLLEILTNNGFRYYIHSIGGQAEKPYVGINSYNGMDMQLDIYAVNQNK